MTTQTQTATPRTDALLNDSFTMLRPATVEHERYQSKRLIEFARTLERELADALGEVYLWKRLNASNAIDLAAAEAELSKPACTDANGSWHNPDDLATIAELREALYAVSVRGLQTDSYTTDMDFRDAVDDGIALTRSAALAKVNV